MQGISDSLVHEWHIVDVVHVHVHRMHACMCLTKIGDSAVVPILLDRFRPHLF